VLDDLVARESSGDRAWPELTEMLRAAVVEATSQRAMKALIAAVVADPESVPLARDIMNRAGEASQAAFVEEALGHRPDGLKIAEAVVGRRLVDMLAAAAARVGPAQVAPLVAVLGREGDPRPVGAVEMLMRRPDEQTRREVAAGLGVAGGPIAVRHLNTLLRDSSAEVAVAAVRSLARSDAPGASAVLAARLAELEVDTRDYPLAKEIVTALARRADPEAAAAMTAIAHRRSLMKRGHFAEMTDLARQALAQQQKGGE
jgi:HEAT repeat protein